MTLEGRYRLTRPIGTGATADVWQATDELLHRQVAVRLLRSDRAHQAERFLEAGRTAARLTHSNAAAVYDVGVADVPDLGRTPYVVMELVTGRSLAARIGDGVHGWREAARTGAEVGAALAHAHGQWVTHGRLTPDKILLSELGAKVIGFTGDSGPDPDGPAADVHALGVLLARCLAGVAPGTLPDELDDLIKQCLRHDPARRPCADELALALSGLAGVRVDLPAWLTAAAQTAYLTAVRAGTTAEQLGLPSPAAIATTGRRGRRAARAASRSDARTTAGATAGLAAGRTTAAGTTARKRSGATSAPARQAGSAARTQVSTDATAIWPIDRSGRSARSSAGTAGPVRSAHADDRTAGRHEPAGRRGHRRWALRGLTALVAAGAVSLVAVAALGQTPVGTLPWFNNPFQTATVPPQPVIPCGAGGAVLTDTTCTTPTQAPAPTATPPAPTQTPSVERTTTRPPASRTASPSASAPPSASASPAPSTSPSASASPSPSASTPPPSASASPSTSVSTSASPATSASTAP